MTAMVAHFHYRTLVSACEELAHMADGVGVFVALIELTTADRLDFPELDAESAFMLIRERDDGSVTVSELTAREARDLVAALCGVRAVACPLKAIGRLAFCGDGRARRKVSLLLFEAWIVCSDAKRHQIVRRDHQPIQVVQIGRVCDCGL